MKKGVAIQPLLWYNINEVKESKRGDNMKQETWMCDICGRLMREEPTSKVKLPVWHTIPTHLDNPFANPINDPTIPTKKKVIVAQSLDLCPNCLRDLANILYDDFGLGEKE